MVHVGDEAPDFTAPLANGDVGEFTLSERLDEAPLVFVFFPGAFTDVCSSEMGTFRDRMDDFEGLGATVYGISVDTPFALNAFRERFDLNFDLISDTNRRIVDAYDLSMDFASMGVDEVAKRAVLVIDGDGVVQYSWVSDDPSIEPDYGEVHEAVADLS